MGRVTHNDVSGLSLTGRRAVVIGGDCELGATIVQAFLAAGAEVWASSQDFADGSSPFGAIGPSISRKLKINVSDIESCQTAFHTIESNGGADIFVNCVGVGGSYPLRDLNFGAWQSIIDVNLVGALIIIGLAGQTFMKNDRVGSIITISSINSELPVPGFAAYCSSKAGVVAATQVAAVELAPRVRVNSIAPGPLSKSTTLLNAFPAFLNSLKRRHLLADRLGNHIDVARVVLFLASPLSEWVTGQTLTVDGGISINHGDIPESFVDELTRTVS